MCTQNYIFEISLESALFACHNNNDDDDDDNDDDDNNTEGYPPGDVSGLKSESLTRTYFVLESRTYLSCIININFQVDLVFFREKYHSYGKALHRFKDGLAVITIYLEVCTIKVPFPKTGLPCCTSLGLQFAHSCLCSL